MEPILQLGGILSETVSVSSCCQTPNQMNTWPWGRTVSSRVPTAASDLDGAFHTRCMKFCEILLAGGEGEASLGEAVLALPITILLEK